MSDVRVTSCFADFDQQNGFTGIAATGAVLTLARKPCFATFAGLGGGGLVRPPLGVSKRSFVELRGKDQQIALAEYSRLVVLFLVLGIYLTQLWQVKGQIFANSMIFQLHESMASKLSVVAA